MFLTFTFSRLFNFFHFILLYVTKCGHILVMFMVSTVLQQPWEISFALIAWKRCRFMIWTSFFFVQMFVLLNQTNCHRLSVSTCLLFSSDKSSFPQTGKNRSSTAPSHVRGGLVGWVLGQWFQVNKACFIPRIILIPPKRTEEMVLHCSSSFYHLRWWKIILLFFM